MNGNGERKEQAGEPSWGIERRLWLMALVTATRAGDPLAATLIQDAFRDVELRECLRAVGCRPETAGLDQATWIPRLIH
jgi:hypothetical protein